MVKWLMRAVRSQAKLQWTDMKAVKPEVRLTNGTFYLNSEAGLIRYTPRTTKDLTQFRDTYVNRFVAVTADYNRKALFHLYAEIRTQVKKASYRGNVRTRLRAATGLMLMLVPSCATADYGERISRLEERISRLEERVTTIEVRNALPGATPNDCIPIDYD